MEAYSATVVWCDEREENHTYEDETCRSIRDVDEVLAQTRFTNFKFRLITRAQVEACETIAPPDIYMSCGNLPDVDD